MKSSKGLRIWHVGNWCIHIGQKYVESPFEAPSKDVEVLNYAQPFVDALRAVTDSDVISQPSWELYHMSPDAFDERLEWATVIVFADVETKCLMLHPDFFQRAKWGNEPLVFPDRFDLLRKWVMDGGHFHMNGGWLSFAGELGKGGWGRSRFHDALPVECLQHDDLIESTAGCKVRCALPSHPAVKDLDWSDAPPLLGFNQCRARTDGKCIVEIENQGKWYPLLAERRLGKGPGNVLDERCQSSLGVNFMKWSQYRQFWFQLFVNQRN
jgi:uncharacterized membrane protein